MSLFSAVRIPTLLTLPAGGTAVVTGAQMIVRVEEEEMLLTLNFQGNILGVTAAVLTMGFEIDGVAAPALPLLGHTFLTGQLQLPVNLSWQATLTKGEHTVALTANTTTAAASVDGAAFMSRFSALRDSNSATLAHGVDSKVQDIF